MIKSGLLGIIAKAAVLVFVEGVKILVSMKSKSF